jgi:hypothetical protein
MRAEVNEKCPLPSMVIICNNYPYSGGRGERHTEELSLEPAKHADLGGSGVSASPSPHCLPSSLSLSLPLPSNLSLAPRCLHGWATEVRRNLNEVDPGERAQVQGTFQLHLLT